MEAIRFPTDNEWEVPTLDIDLQIDRCLLPLLGWGSRSRRQRAPGAWHFYCDDYRFAALWKNPLALVDTQPTWAIEPNPSLEDDLPAAVALWLVYRKRWAARYWQSHGIPVAVDLNVPPRFQSMNLLGVPRGWKAFATRAKAAELHVLESEYNLASRHAGGTPLLVVIGGGETANQFCRGLPGAVWLAGGFW